MADEYVSMDSQAAKSMAGPSPAAVARRKSTGAAEDAPAVKVLQGHQDSIICMEATGNLLVSGSVDSTLRMWDVEAGTCIKTLDAHTDWVRCLCISSSELLITGGDDKTLRMWNLKSGDCVQTFPVPSINCVAVLAGQAFFGSDDTNIRGLDLASGEITMVLQGHVGPVNCLMIDLTSGALISGSGDCSVRVWDIHAGKFLTVITTHQFSVNCLEVVDTTLFTGSGDCLIHATHLQSGKKLREYRGHTGPIFCLHAAHGVLISGSGDCSIRVWDLTTDACLAALTGHSDWVNALHSNDGFLFSGSVDRTVRTWSWPAVAKQFSNPPKPSGGGSNTPVTSSASGRGRASSDGGALATPATKADVPAYEVYTMGCGGDGQLGVGSFETVSPTPVPIRALHGAKIAQIDCGGGAEEFHSAAVTVEGALLTWGSGQSGQLGHGTVQRIALPKQVMAIKERRVVRVACGSSFTACITGDGTVYTFGRAHFGQLGLGDEKSIAVPSRVEALSEKRIVQIACGSAHAMALSDAGEVFTWGWNVNGQLGHGDVNNVNSPKGVKGLLGKNVSSIACGLAHSCAISDDERSVFTWGWDEYGQLGHGISLFGNKNRAPRSVSALQGKGVTFVCCGSSHTFAITDNSDVYAWGWGKDGQLGLGGTKSKHAPTLLKALSGHGIVTMAACGTHSAAVSSHGPVYTWGSGATGHLGHGGRDNLDKPQLVAELAGRHMKAICATGGITEGHTMILTDNTRSLMVPITDAPQLATGSEGSNAPSASGGYVPPMSASLPRRGSTSASVDASGSMSDDRAAARAAVAAANAADACEEPEVAPKQVGVKRRPSKTKDEKKAASAAAAAAAAAAPQSRFKNQNAEPTPPLEGLAATATPMERLAALQRQLGAAWESTVSQLERAQAEDAASVAEEKKILIDRRRELNHRQLELRLEINTLTKQQADAAESEDYEAADSLTETIERKKTMLATLHHEMKLVLDNYDVLENRVHGDMVEALRLRKEALENMVALQAQQASKAAQYVADAVEHSNSMIERANRKEEKLRESLSNLETEAQNAANRLSEQEAQAKSAWQQQEATANTATANLASVKAERETLEAEMAALQRRIAKIKEEESKAETKMQSAVSALDAVRRPFLEGQERLVASKLQVEGQLQQVRNELEETTGSTAAAQQDKAQISTAAEQHASTLKQVSEAVAQQQAGLDALSDGHRARMEYAKRRAELMRMDATIEGEDEESAAAAQREIMAAKENSARLAHEVQQVSFNVLRLQQESSKLRQSIGQVQGRIDEMMVEKNLAASNRDYKAAGVLNSQIKELQQTLTDTESTMERVTTELAEKNAALATHKTDLANAKSVMSKLESHVVARRVNALHVKESELQKLAEEGIEREDYLAADLLQAEIEACAQFQRELRRAYGLDDPAAPNLIDMGDDDGAKDKLEDELDPLNSSGIGAQAEQEAEAVFLGLGDTSGSPAPGSGPGGEGDDGVEAASRETLQSAIDALEESLQQAVADEEYEMADALNAEIATLAAKRDALPE